MRFERVYRWIFLFFLVASMLPIPRVSAAGNIFTEYVGGTVSSHYDNEDSMYVQARFKFVENGTGIGTGGNNLICTVTVRLNLKAVGNNRWQVASIDFSNPAVSSGSCDIEDGGKKITFINPNKDVLATYTADSPAKMTKYGFVVGEFANHDGFYANLRLAFGTATESCVRGYGSEDFDQAFLPINGFRDISNCTDSQTNIKVDQYIPHIDKFGFSAQQAQQWFGDTPKTDLRITIYDKVPDNKNNPPKITIPQDLSRKRPEVTFKLSHIGGEGSGWVLYDNITWLLFEAYAARTPTRAPELIPGMFLLVNDNLGNHFVISDNIDAIRQGQFADRTEIDSGLDVNDSDIERLFNYVYFHVPKDTAEENCGNENVYTIGPEKADFVTYDKITPKRSDPARELNANCLYPDQGWPKFWGVSVHSIPLEKLTCDINFIIGTGDIGDAFNTMVKCLFQRIFKPLIDTAAGWVQSAAGLSWREDSVETLKIALAPRRDI